MEDKKRQLGEIQGIIEEDSNPPTDTKIDQLYMVIIVEGEDYPLCINVKEGDPLREWVTDLINQKLEENSS